MGFLKKIFGGGGGGTAKDASADVKASGVSGDPAGMYFYIQPDNCDEVVRLRVNRDNDLSLNDDDSGYWVHKVVRGAKCFNGVDVDLYFDMSKRLKDSTLKGGKLVEEAAYNEWTTQS